MSPDLGPAVLRFWENYFRESAAQLLLHSYAITIAKDFGSADARAEVAIPDDTFEAEIALSDLFLPWSSESFRPEEARIVATHELVHLYVAPFWREASEACPPHLTEVLRRSMERMVSQLSIVLARQIELPNEEALLRAIKQDQKEFKKKR